MGCLPSDLLFLLTDVLTLQRSTGECPFVRFHLSSIHWVILGMCTTGHADLQRPLSQRPLTQRPLTQRPLVQRPLAQRPLAQRRNPRSDRTKRETRTAISALLLSVKLPECQASRVSSSPLHPHEFCRLPSSWYWVESPPCPHPPAPCASCSCQTA